MGAGFPFCFGFSWTNRGPFLIEKGLGELKFLSSTLPSSVATALFSFFRKCPFFFIDLILFIVFLGKPVGSLFYFTMSPRSISRFQKWPPPGCTCSCIIHVASFSSGANDLTSPSVFYCCYGKTSEVKLILTHSLGFSSAHWALSFGVCGEGEHMVRRMWQAGWTSRKQRRGGARLTVSFKSIPMSQPLLNRLHPLPIATRAGWPHL